MSKEKLPVVETTKEKSKTEEFKEYYQKVVQAQLGVKVSKQKAWDFFKATVLGTVNFVINLPEEGEAKKQRLPLAGIGSFEVLKSQAKGKKAGFNEDGTPMAGVKQWPFNPRFKFYPSQVIEQILEQHYDLTDHGIEIKDYALVADTVKEEPKETKETKEPKEVAPKEEPKAPKTKKAKETKEVSDLD